MNLFILSYNPVECAQMMMDVHIVKIILEAVQMLSSAKRLLTVVADPLEKPNREDVGKANALDLPLYRVAHVNHPVSIWVRESYANYCWTLDLVDAMHDEWRLRYGHGPDKVHKSYAVAAFLRLNPPPLDAFAQVGLTPFAVAMPDDCKVFVPAAEWWDDDVVDPVASYRAYYRSPMKRNLSTWRVRGAPDWFFE